MFRVFQEEKLITVLMFTCMGVSIFVRVLLGLLYRNLIKEADNMASTENKHLKQCKLKFANCYQLSNGVPNIQIFVDKFLNKMSFMHISYGMLYHLSGQTELLSVVFSGVGICRSILAGRTLGDVLPFYIVSFFGLYIYFSVSTIVDIRGKRRVLKINLVDYLENHFAPRIDVTKRDLEMLYGEAFFEEQGTEERGRIGTSRTVKLMPIGGRLAAGAENIQPARAQRAAAPAPPAQAFMGQAPMSQAPVGQAFMDPASVGQVPQENIYEEESDTAYPNESAKVSEEELEALLKEFLTT